MKITKSNLRKLIAEAVSKKFNTFSNLNEDMETPDRDQIIHVMDLAKLIDVNCKKSLQSNSLNKFPGGLEGLNKLEEILTGWMNEFGFNMPTHVEESARKISNKSLKEFRMTKSWGNLPSSEQLWNLMDGEDYSMELRGADSLAWEYATTISPDPEAGSLKAGSGLHSSLEALINAPDPEELTDIEFETVSEILDQWFERYGDYDQINNKAQELASTIVETLGVKWI